MDDLEKSLVDMAFEAAKHSYSPYSNFSVGAAILTASGKIYSGANIENASYGATVCAERTAALKAVYDGEKVFKAIAVVGYHKDKSENDAIYAYPCGICRQFLREFAAKDMKVYVAKTSNEILSTTLEAMLPHSFGPESLLD